MDSSRSSIAPSPSNVLVLYTGGTIGMLHSPQGYKPYPQFLYDHLRSTARFHDPLERSVYAHSRSVATYKEWSRAVTAKESHNGSHRATPAAPSPRGAMPIPDSVVEGAVTKLKVAVDTPTGSPPLLSPETSMSSAELMLKVKTGDGDLSLPSLVTPRTSDGKRIRYVILEYDPLIDSSEMGPQDWIRIATDIELNYQGFDAFVVLHGTDTMAYTTSALSFMLENLGKTVIVTGAQIPLSELRNDAAENLFSALQIAGHYLIPEVSLLFNNQLFRGNRSTKISSFDFDAFASPNFPPLVKIGIDVGVDWGLVLAPRETKTFRAHKSMAVNVATLRLFPGITASTIRAFTASPIQGVVLESFGAGNAPQRKDLLDAFREASDRGVVVVNVTQCHRGAVTDIYEAGRQLAEVGIIGGRDLTTESALAKLAYLLSKPDLTPSHIRLLIPQPLRGELTPPPEAPSFVPPPSSDSKSPSNLQTDRIAALLSRVLVLNQPKEARIPPGQHLRDGSSSASFVRNVSATGTSIGLSTGWPVTSKDIDAAENALFPLLVHQAAAAQSEDVLSRLLEGLYGQPHTSDSTTPAVDGGSERHPDRPPPVRRATVAPQLVLNTSLVGLQTPLHAAAIHGRARNCALLLAHGAHVHVRDVSDHTPLFYAAQLGHEDVVAVLVEAGGHLGRTERERGDVGWEMTKARKTGDEATLRAWMKAGGGDEDVTLVSEQLQK